MVAEKGEGMHKVFLRTYLSQDKDIFFSNPFHVEHFKSDLSFILDGTFQFRLDIFQVLSNHSNKATVLDSAALEK